MSPSAVLKSVKIIHTLCLGILRGLHRRIPFATYAAELLAAFVLIALSCSWKC